MVFSMPPTLGERYSPLYFLAALGAGGLTVTFFMYLFFWVPHPDQPVPVFEDIAARFMAGDLTVQAMITVALLGIAAFAVLHFRLLAWNLAQLKAWRGSQAYRQLQQSNAETQLKAVPLTLAMAVNVAFILGLVFVPELWSIVEYLFPFAIAAFLAIGIYALRLLSAFFGRVLTQGGFDLQANNSFAQLLPAFALSMVSVGLAAPVAMSSTAWIVGVAHFFSTFFMIAAVIVSLVALVLGFYSMMQHGTAPEAAPTLMVVVPIMTVLGITLMRIDHGLHVHFNAHVLASDNLVLLSRIVALQVLFLLLGGMVMRRQGYYGKYLSPTGERSPGSWALVCPGVALSVMWHFLVNKGWVATGLLVKFSLAYWVAVAPAILMQLMTIWLVIHLQRQHFRVTPQRRLAPRSV